MDPRISILSRTNLIPSSLFPVFSVLKDVANAKSPMTSKLRKPNHFVYVEVLDLQTLDVLYKREGVSENYILIVPLLQHCRRVSVI